MSYGGRWESNPRQNFWESTNPLLVGRLRSCGQGVGEGVAKRHGQDGSFGALQPPATILRSIGRTQASGHFLFVGLRARKIRAVSS